MQKNRDTILTITAFLLFFVVVGFTVVSINFLASKLTKFLNQEIITVPPVIHFDTEGLKKVNELFGSSQSVTASSMTSTSTKSTSTKATTTKK